MADEIQKLDVPWILDSGAPGELLFQPEAEPVKLVLPRGSDGSNYAPAGGFRFLRCWALKFGYPNDEALPGHPLYDKGLSFYNFHEVLDSSWLHELNEDNRIAFPTSTLSDFTSRHMIVTFHDST